MKKIILSSIFIVLHLIGLSQSISAGVHTAFLCHNKRAVTVGYNTYGSLGNGFFSSQTNIPAEIMDMGNLKSLSCGFDFTLFLSDTGSVWVTGHNDNGQFGDGTNVNKNIPTLLTTITDVQTIAAGSNHSLFLKND